MSDHYAPPLRAPIVAPDGLDFTQDERIVTAGFFKSVPEMKCHGGSIRRGDVVLDVQYFGHRQQVRGASVIAALANVQRLYEDIHVSTSQEAA